MFAITYILNFILKPIQTYKKAKEYGFEKPILEKRLTALEDKMREQEQRYALEAAGEKLNKVVESYYLELTAVVLFLLIITI